MDDVLYITTESKEIRIMQDQNKAMKIGSGMNKHALNLGAMKFEYWTAYKYMHIGFVQNEKKNNMKDHIQTLKAYRE